MGIPTFDVDVEIISKLGDFPGADDGLGPEGFRAKFDIAAKLIKEYINSVLIPNINMTTDVDALKAGVQKQLRIEFSVDQAKYFEKVIQSGDYVLNTGYQFRATKLSDTLVRVNSGEAVVQGHVVTFNPEEPVNIAVVAGTYGTFRNDLICLRFIRAADGTETTALVYLQGETSQAGGIDPEYLQNDINVLTAAETDLPLYRIRVENTTATLDALFTPYESLADVMTDKIIEKLSIWEGGSY